MRSSNSAKLMAAMTPPYAWLSAVSLSTIKPQSWIARMRVTFTMPVSTSTLASANCTPLVPLDDRPSSHFPSTEIGSVPINLHASFHDRPLDGLPLTKMRPSSAARSSGFAPSVGATLANNSSSALTDVTRIAGLTDAAVVLPPDPPLNGYTVSPISGFTAPNGSPNVSAATIATIVRVPVPMSWVPHFTTTLPSDAMSMCACDPRPAPPHRCAETPMPILIGPGAGSPVACRLSQPN